MVVESHLVAKEDGFQGWPKTSYEKVNEHMERSCAKLKAMGLTQDCGPVYKSHFMRVWTPAENGAIGQGSTGNNKPSAECEMWTMNMFWNATSKPAPGTKFILKANGKAVVACAGYETGPGGSKWVAGAQPEVHWYLGTDNESVFTAIGRAVDQSLPYGPLECAL